jgi:hypothetical protein
MGNASLPRAGATARAIACAFTHHDSKEIRNMAETGTLHDAFIDELRDTYDAERNSPRRCRNSPRQPPRRRCATRSNRTSRRRRARSSASNGCSKPG